MLFNGKSVILVYCEYPEEAPKPVSDTINIHPESVSSKVETEEKKNSTHLGFEHKSIQNTTPILYQLSHQPLILWHCNYLGQDM